MKKIEKFKDITIENIKTGYKMSGLTLDEMAARLGTTRKYGIMVCWRGKYKKTWKVESTPVGEQCDKITHDEWLEKRKLERLMKCNNK